MLDFKKVLKERKQQQHKDNNTMSINCKVALWDNDRADSEKSPILRGKLTDAEGNVIGEISLWRSDKYEKGGKYPRLSGTIKPPYVKDAGGNGSVF